jgi:hypothetical protein
MVYWCAARELMAVPHTKPFFPALLFDKQRLLKNLRVKVFKDEEVALKAMQSKANLS